MVKIETHPDKCVGCRLCQMRCSFQYLNNFSISNAHIVIEWNEKDCYFEIEFRDKCTMCGLCTAYCVYGALEIRKEGK